VVSSDFFLPFYNKGKVMIAGSGQQCLIRSFIVRTMARKEKTEDNSQSQTQQSTGGNGTDNTNRNCDCCLIF
jgi:hypothetical protein